MQSSCATSNFHIILSLTMLWLHYSLSFFVKLEPSISSFLAKWAHLCWKSLGLAHPSFSAPRRLNYWCSIHRDLRSESWTRTSNQTCLFICVRWCVWKGREGSATAHWPSARRPLDYLVNLTKRHFCWINHWTTAGQKNRTMPVYKQLKSQKTPLLTQTTLLIPIENGLTMVNLNFMQNKLFSLILTRAIKRTVVYLPL